MITPTIDSLIELQTGRILVLVPTGTKLSLKPTWLQRYRGYGADRTVSMITTVEAVSKTTKEYNRDTLKSSVVPLTSYSVGDTVSVNLYMSEEDVILINGKEYTIIRDNSIDFKFINKEQ